jgi:hypothetical protein
VRPSVILLMVLGVAVAGLAMPRIETGAAGSTRALAFGIMAIAGIGLVLTLAADVLVRRARRAQLRRMSGWRLERARRSGALGGGRTAGIIR